MARFKNSVSIDEIVDPQLFRDRYCWGTDLGNPIGVVGLDNALAGVISQADRTALRQYMGNMPDHVISFHLRTSLSEASQKLDTPLTLTVVKGTPVDDGLDIDTDYDEEMPRLPWSREDAETYYKIVVPGPIISVQRVRLYSLNNLILEVSAAKGNLDTIRIASKKYGIMHLMPLVLAGGVVSDFGFLVQTRQGYIEPALNLRHGFTSNHVPDSWSVDYIRGPVTEDGRAGEVELVIANWIWLNAARLLYTVSVAQISSITSSSMSIDGVSQSVGLASSATTSIMSGIEYVLNELEKQIDWKSLRRTKRGMPITFI